MTDMGEIFMTISGGDPVMLGLLGGVFISLLNAIGAIPSLFLKKLPEGLNDVSLGFAAGVMLAASFTSLIMPGIELGGILPVISGILLGAFAISVVDRVVPHAHRIIGIEGPMTPKLKAIWLFVVAITLHNMPEGLAVGVGFGSGNMSDAIVLMVAIGIQNMPEGLSVSFSLMEEGESKNKMRSFLVAVCSGLIEIPLCVLGVIAVSIASPILPYAMGFAAGAMLFVISDEIIPETHRLGHERTASYGLIIGFSVMLILDIVLG